MTAWQCDNHHSFQVPCFSSLSLSFYKLSFLLLKHKTQKKKCKYVQGYRTMHILFRTIKRVALFIEKVSTCVPIVKPISDSSCLFSIETVFHLVHSSSSRICRFIAPWTEGLPVCILVSKKWLPLSRLAAILDESLLVFHWQVN